MCARNCSRIFLFIVNFLVLLVGAAGVALGIWLRVDSTSVLKFFKFVSTDQAMSSAGSNWSYIDVISIVLIAAGAFLIIVGFCGCCGAWKEILFLLWLYAAVVLVLGVLLLVAAILAVIFQATVQDYVDKLAVRALNESFDDRLDGNSSSFGVAWYQLMQTFQCCGWNGTSDFTPAAKFDINVSVSAWSASVQSMLNFCSFSYLWSCVNHRYVDTGKSGVVYPAALLPSACCRFNNQNAILLTGSKTDAQISDPLCPMVPTSSNSYKDTGCKSSIQSYVTSRQLIFIIVAFVAAAILLLALICSCILLCSLKRERVEYHSSIQA